MHKNAYQPKVLNGNWFENRFTDQYDQLADETSNTYLPNPSHNKYVATSKAIGNVEGFKKVSCDFVTTVHRKTLVTLPRTSLISKLFLLRTRLTRRPRNSLTQPWKKEKTSSKSHRIYWLRTRSPSRSTAKHGRAEIINSKEATPVRSSPDINLFNSQ